MFSKGESVSGREAWVANGQYRQFRMRSSKNRVDIHDMAKSGRMENTLLVLFFVAQGANFGGSVLLSFLVLYLNFGNTFRVKDFYPFAALLYDYIELACLS
jgi:hypothetical protein